MTEIYSKPSGDGRADLRRLKQIAREEETALEKAERRYEAELAKSNLR